MNKNNKVTTGTTELISQTTCSIVSRNTPTRENDKMGTLYRLEHKSGEKPANPPIKDTIKTNDETKGNDKKPNDKERELNKTKLKNCWKYKK